MANQILRTELGPASLSPTGDRARFGGSMPRSYHGRLVPLLFHDYAEDLAARTGPIAGGAVLETAAGTGVVSQRLRATLPTDTRLTVSDLSPDMLALAREALNGAPGVDFLAADATALPFDSGSFDAVVCQFGVMFFRDEPTAFAEATRVLKPGGRFLFNVWDDLTGNPLPACVHEAFASAAPADPPRFLEKPFRALDLTRIVRDLQAAGFAEIRMTALPKICRVASATNAVHTFLEATPLGVQVAERGLDGVAAASAVRALAERFAGGDESARFTVPMRAVVFEAIRED